MMLFMLHMSTLVTQNLHLFSHESCCHKVPRAVEFLISQQASNMIHSTKQSVWFVQKQYVLPIVKTFKDGVILISRLTQETPLSSHCFLPLLTTVL